VELLEREQFLSELEAIRNDVAAGNGRFVLVTGTVMGAEEARGSGQP
jgi:hypothetical protein